MTLAKTAPDDAGSSRVAAVDRDLLPWLVVLSACAIAFALRDDLPWLKALPADLLPPISDWINVVMSAFVGEKRRFNKPVLVDISGDGRLKAIGFVTRDSMENFGRPEDVAVYFPQSYNFAGQVVIISRAAVTAVALDAADAMAFIVSGGVTGK